MSLVVVNLLRSSKQSEDNGLLLKDLTIPDMCGPIWTCNKT